MTDRRAVAIALVLAAAACAPAPRIAPPRDSSAQETSPFQPFTPARGYPELLLSDFDEPGVASVVTAGTPPRHGVWYAYNDGSPTCAQMPSPQEPYLTSKPTTPAPGSGGQALHAAWRGCSTWGAGVAAQLNGPEGDAGARVLPYDLSGYTGVTFWAKSEPVPDGLLRVMFPMIDDTEVKFGGLCDEALVGPGRCNDAYQTLVVVSAAATWQQFVVPFSSLSQQGWGERFTWNPAHVTTIQLQAPGAGSLADFWIDDVYLTR